MANIQTIQQTETSLSSLSKINANYEALNTDKIEADSADTLTNKTIDADNNTLSNIEVDNIKTSAKTGQDTKVVTGTNGTANRVVKWDSNGDAVETSFLEDDVTLNTDTDVSNNDWVLDEDDMASDSDTKVPTQQSVKAYVDDQTSNTATDSVYVGNLPEDDEAITYSDSRYTIGVNSNGSFHIATETSGGIMNDIDVFGTWASANQTVNIFILNGFMYVAMIDINVSPNEYRIYRFDETSITSTGTLMTFSGSNPLTDSSSTLRFACDGTYLYITRLGGNSANQYEIAKYSISGTVFTYDSTITLSDSATFSETFAVDSLGNIYTYDSASSGTIKKYNSSGTLLTTATQNDMDYVVNYKGEIYTANLDNDLLLKVLG